jgi:hypothetical protein
MRFLRHGPPMPMHRDHEADGGRSTWNSLCEATAPGGSSTGKTKMPRVQPRQKRKGQQHDSSAKSSTETQAHT